MDTNMKYTGKVIKELRENVGESQEQLANAIGAPNRETIARWETGSRDIKRDYLIAIARHFKVSTDYLLGLSDVSSVSKDIKVACMVTGLSEKAIKHLADMQYCDFGIPYQRTDIIESIILSGHFRRLLNLLCETCLFAEAENLLNATEYEASSDWKTVNLKCISKNDLIEFSSQKAIKEFNKIIDQMVKEAQNNGKNRKKEE